MPGTKKIKAQSLKSIDALVHVLSGQEGSMTGKELVAAATPLAKTTAKDPAVHVNSIMYAETRKPAGKIVRSGRGEFRLRREDEMPAVPVEAAQEQAEQKGSRKTPTSKSGPKEVASVVDLDAMLLGPDAPTQADVEDAIRATLAGDPAPAEKLVADLAPSAKPDPKVKKSSRKRSTARTAKAKS